MTTAPAGAAPDRPAPLVVAKLIAPPPRPGHLPRPQLVARLAASPCLTVLSAPAGFGKTTLLAAWAAALAPSERAEGASRRRVAWLALDAEDGDPVRFWGYFLAALRLALPELPADLEGPLRATPPRLEAAVAGIANALAATPGGVTLILDDYHTIGDARVHRALAALVEHCPPGLRLVVAGRADPPLPLARLRARGLLAELRAAELRFSGAEAAAFLRGTMGLDLEAEAVAALDATTEGWPAGLQLAALWLQEHPEAAADRLAALADVDRYLVAFLAEEVLQRQPSEIQRFLLDTAILDRMCPELCDYLTAGARSPAGGGTPGMARPSQQILEELERRNLFVVALDPGGAWYRYHTLFRDTLRRELARRRGRGAVCRLHRRAAAWLAAASAEEPALLEPALGHALAGGSEELAADLILPRCDELGADGQLGRLLGWLAALPAAALAARPALALRYAWALFLQGCQEEAARQLASAEAALAARPAPDPLTAALPHAIRAAMAADRRDGQAALRHAGLAAALLPPDAPRWAAELATARGLAHLGCGEAREAAAALQEAADLADRAGSGYGVMVASWHLGRARMALGRLDDAARAFRQIGAAGDARYDGYRELGLAAIAYERDALADARDGALRGLRAIEAAAGQPRAIIFAHRLLARIARATGAPADAAAWLDRGEQLARHLALHGELAELLALRAQFALCDGDHGAAEEWAAGAGLDPTAPEVGREAELLTLAHALAERGQAGAAMGIATALRASAKAHGRTRSLITCELAAARAHLSAGERHGAAAALAAAARLAESAGLRRALRDAGPAVLALAEPRVMEAAEPGAAAPGDEVWCEALSERELRVLGLIAAGCSNEEIASALIVSVNTIKTHIKRIYQKLQVHSRVGAVERARGLGIYG